jgi:hypothetical protein
MDTRSVPFVPVNATFRISSFEEEPVVAGGAGGGGVEGGTEEGPAIPGGAYSGGVDETGVTEKAYGSETMARTSSFATWAVFPETNGTRGFDKVKNSIRSSIQASA